MGESIELGEDYLDVSLVWGGGDQGNPFYFTAGELRNLGATNVGKNVKVSRKACFYSFRGEIGDHTRVDDFCIIKGWVDFGAYIHVAPFCMISGTGGQVQVGDCSSLSARCSIYTSTNDYRSDDLTGPIVPSRYTTVINGPVTLGRGSVLGVGCTVMPKVEIGPGASVGAGCVLTSHVPPGGIVRMERSQLRGTLRDHRKIVEMIKELIGR